MELFLAEAFSFPTIIFAFPLVIFLLFWLMAFAGFVDLEILDADVEIEADSSSGSGFSSWLQSLGLDGVPFTVALTLLDIYAFAITYLARKYLAPLFDGLLTATAAGAIIAVFAVLIAIPLSALCIKPLRKLFITHEAIGKDQLQGRICTVTTLKVTSTFGQATTEDGMLLNVRASEPNDLSKGSKVALLEYFEQYDTYSVVSEAELMAMSSSTESISS